MWRDATALISGTTAKATIPFATNRAALIPTFTTTGARVELGGAPLQSGTTPGDYSAPVVYHVVAADGSSADYTVTVDAQLVQQASFSTANLDMGDGFGGRVAISRDGSTLVVGAIGDSSAATGVNGDQTDNSATRAGAAYVFTRSGDTWTLQAFLKASNTEAADMFGDAVSVSADGNTVAVGAVGEASNATGVGGNQADNSVGSAGAVYVFTRSGTTWSQQAYVKPAADVMFGYFGESVSLSADGNTLAIGSEGDATTGAAYTFTRTGTTWAQQAYITASNKENNDRFGSNLVLSADGNTLAVGAWNEASAATGIDGNQADNSAFGSGAVYVFARSGAIWTQQAYVKASNTGMVDRFSNDSGINNGIALSADGNTMAVGASSEDSAATGIDGNQADNSAMSSGAVYVFSRAGTTWSQQAYVKASNAHASYAFGSAVSLSPSGDMLVVGSPTEASDATGINGDQTNMAFVNAGAVYVFLRAGTTWSQQAYVKETMTRPNDDFGWTVSCADSTMFAVGAVGAVSGYGSISVFE